MSCSWEKQKNRKANNRNEQEDMIANVCYRPDILLTDNVVPIMDVCYRPDILHTYNVPIMDAAKLEGHFIEMICWVGSFEMYYVLFPSGKGWGWLWSVWSCLKSSKLMAIQCIS